MASEFFTDCPYSMLKLKRRLPGQEKNMPRILKWTYSLPHSFDYFWWDFDEWVIQKVAQYFHVGRALTVKKLPGYFLGFLSFLITFACALEFWLIAALALTFYGRDGLAKWLSHALLMNFLIG